MFESLPYTMNEDFFVLYSTDIHDPDYLIYDIENRPDCDIRRPWFMVKDFMECEAIKCYQCSNREACSKDIDAAVLGTSPFVPKCKNAKWLYRLESRDPNNGLWYNSRNEFVCGIAAAPNCTTKDMPMGWDERYHKDGKVWNSSCSNLGDILHWIDPESAKILMSKGFTFAKYLATEYVEYDKETTFAIETSLMREEIDIEMIFPRNKNKPLNEHDEFRRRYVQWNSSSQ